MFLLYAVAGQGRQVTHEIVDPTRLIFKLDARGAHEGLDITAADHSVTALRFRVAARPETLDGVLSDIRSANCKTSLMPSTSTPEVSRCISMSTAKLPARELCRFRLRGEPCKATSLFLALLAESLFSHTEAEVAV
jgi:hypothetical protein